MKIINYLINCYIICFNCIISTKRLQILKVKLMIDKLDYKTRLNIIYIAILGMPVLGGIYLVLLPFNTQLILLDNQKIHSEVIFWFIAILAVIWLCIILFLKFRKKLVYSMLFGDQ